MKPRERVLRALMREEPDRVPLFELAVSPQVLSKIFNKKPEECLSIFAGWEAEFNLYEKLGLDSSSIYTLMFSPKNSRGIDKDRYVDSWGRIYSANVSAAYISRFYIGGYLTTPEKYEEFPKLDPLDSFGIEQCKIALKAAGDRIFPVAAVGSIWEVQGEALGWENMFRYMFTKPDFVREVLEDSTKFLIELGKACIDLGAEVLLDWDDYGYTNGPMMSPKHFKQFIFPCLKRAADEFHRRGAFLMVHSDGDIRLLMDMIIEAGVDAIQPLEPKAGMNIDEVAEKWGDKICLVGNIDVAHLLPFGTTEEVAQEVRRAIDAAAPGGGYLLGSGHQINDWCKPENFLAQIKTAKEYGKYPLH
nr:uroporphyrinogen decarboxylase family protein [Candidatus Freyarchaeota archaeon]